MKIAVIGSGISGLTCAYYLDREHDVTLYEKNAYAGGHTDTHNLHIEGKSISVDSGFIVFNEDNYPNFTRMLRELGVSWQKTDMSFSMVNEQTGQEYGAAGFKRLFAKKQNLINPTFYRMLRDLMRFYKHAPQLLESDDDSLTLGEYLHQHRYSDAFIYDHILPMASALWSAPTATIASFPARYFVSFMANHRMLQLRDRPQWNTIRGGSDQYVHKILNRLRNPVRLSTGVASVSRQRGQVHVMLENGQTDIYDHVILATHSDQALAMLADPSGQETDILGAIRYQQNTVTLHSDIRQLPANRAAWASWNARASGLSGHQCHVSYWMNLLQNLPCDTPLIVTLNASDQIDADTVWAERHYSHPVYTPDTLRAQKRKNDINGQRNTWFCGAYWGWGFHEDGVRSALDVITAIQQEQQHDVA